MNKSASLNPFEKSILLDKATEQAFTGPHIEAVEQGSYLCKLCGLALFRADNQFTSTCGWPSFDDQLHETVHFHPDADGRRTEIVCARCQGHLGHVFNGEGYTAKNTRYCVNGAAIDFVNDEDVRDSEEATVAGGCFWGVEHYLMQLEGVLKVESGYCGGHVDSPNYQQVCQGNTGHLEAVRVLYNPEKTNFKTICEHFLEIHDPTQDDGQGPDIGPQYLSAVFYYNQEQKDIAADRLEFLKKQGLAIATQLLPVSTFWPAEAYHQNYYAEKGTQPYCHSRVKRF